MSFKVDYPLWISLWLVIQIALQTWDAAFVMLRPRSMKGGDFFAIFAPYDLYIQVDKSYGELQNGFVIAQTLVNFLEILLIIIGLLSRKSFCGFSLILLGSIMSCSKTILYFLVDICDGFEFTGHNDWPTWISLYFIPSFVWIIFPALTVMWGYGVLTRHVHGNTEKKQN
ncbi:predicted protein [Naegleria gruberi]|uniref:Predicted protein n=1 Tax=Naegleria gruberi TaxID=5762 RepID=D2VCN6_NAEGR|nr:uncharacterized protein NAEGRDRAFT_66637 [Naegleria gruberi]EFC45452.1 predicted protein [Naegleria gruberi]|eukprot:XP_002678196.1 predicted protein [Naegleria gruberi strain NEG-M]